MCERITSLFPLRNESLFSNNNLFNKLLCDSLLIGMITGIGLLILGNLSIKLALGLGCAASLLYLIGKGRIIQTISKKKDPQQAKFVELFKSKFHTAQAEDLFKPIRSNVKNLKEAKIIFLSEFHDDVTDQIRNAQVIANLYRDGDVILVEHPDSKTILKTFHQIKELQNTSLTDRTICIKGWDSESDDKKLCDGNKEIRDLRSSLTKLNWEGEEAKKLIEEKINKMQSTEDREFCRKFAAGIVDEKESALRQATCQGCYYSIRSDYEKFGPLSEVHIETFQNRQKNLIKNIQNNLTKDNTIFVIAGEAHCYFERTVDKQERLKKVQEEGVQIVIDFVSTYPFAVLASCNFF